jgi:PIN domain nuclease of toxin-antitoxin system
MSPILLDTHAAIWAADGRLTAKSVTLIEDAQKRGELLLSPITAWEIGMLVSKGRLAITSTVNDYVRALFGQQGVVLAQFTPTVALAATALPGTLHGDPADRMLVATAAAYGASLVTRDRKILAYAKATGYLRCLPC